MTYQSSILLAIEILSSDRHVQYWIKISNRHLDDYIETKLGWRGLAMVYGYRAYKHPYLMAGALSYWSRTQPRIIARFYRVSGWIVHETSSGVAAFAGFVRQDGSGGHLDCHETLLLMTLSSHLAECTKNDEYKEHALLAADRIKSMLLDPNTMLIKDGTQSSVSVSSTRVDGDYSGLSSCFTGLFIEALSLLASVTDDESWMTLAIQIATAAMKTSEWHGSDGILDVGSDGNVASNEDCRAFKGVLLRGLLEAYRRSNNVPFRNLVRSYINVQFNALRELASDGEYYGMDWKGPYKGPFLHAQLAALDTMVAAIGVNDS
ncbi:hypothetical protein FRC03_010502 [Tulasnella sp. 419]|nr:hypothetical protein FRC03_010502 [Tulasnella sp. 419]